MSSRAPLVGDRPSCRSLVFRLSFGFLLASFACSDGGGTGPEAPSHPIDSQAPPTIFEVIPNQGRPGDVVIIAGRDLTFFYCHGFPGHCHGEATVVTFDGVGAEWGEINHANMEPIILGINATVPDIPPGPARIVVAVGPMSVFIEGFTVIP